MSSPDRIRLCKPVDKVFQKFWLMKNVFISVWLLLLRMRCVIPGYVDLSLTIAEDHVVFHVLDYGSGYLREREVVVTRFARGILRLVLVEVVLGLLLCMNLCS